MTRTSSTIDAESTQLNNRIRFLLRHLFDVKDPATREFLRRFFGLYTEADLAAWERCGATEFRLLDELYRWGLCVGMVRAHCPPDVDLEEGDLEEGDLTSAA